MKTLYRNIILQTLLKIKKLKIKSSQRAVILIFNPLIFNKILALAFLRNNLLQGNDQTVNFFAGVIHSKGRSDGHLVA